MDLEKFRINQVKYQISDIMLYIGDKSIFPVPPEAFSHLYIEKNFDGKCFPYCQIKINIPSWVYRDMQRNPLKLRVSFNLKYGLFNDKTQYGAPMTTDLSGKFYALIGDSSMNANESDLIDIEKSQKQYKKGYMQNDMRTVDMLLINEMYYMGKDVVTNCVLSSATPIEGIACTLNGAGYSNVLISRPDNTRSYNEFKLLPLTTIKQIDNILSYYTVFKTGHILFFDLNRGYILSRSSNCDAWLTNEYKSVNILSLANYQKKTERLSGFNIDSKAKCFNIVIQEGTYEFSNILNTTTISNIKSINAQTGNVHNTKVPNSKGRGSIIYGYSHGTSGVSTIANELKERESIFRLNSTSIVMGCITPNKQFKINLDNTKSKELNGAYRLSSASFSFIKAGDYLTPMTSLVLKK